MLNHYVSFRMAHLFTIRMLPRAIRHRMIQKLFGQKTFYHSNNHQRLEWVEWWPPAKYTHVITAGTSDVTLLGIRVFVDVINLRILRRGDHLRLFMGPKSHDKYPDKIDPQRRHTQRRLCEDGAERCSHKARDAERHQKLEEAENRFSSRAPRGSGLHLHFDSEQLTPKIGGNTLFHFVLSHLVWYNLLQQLQELI